MAIDFTLEDHVATITINHPKRAGGHIDAGDLATDRYHNRRAIRRERVARQEIRPTALTRVARNLWTEKAIASGGDVVQSQLGARILSSPESQRPAIGRDLWSKARGSASRQLRD